MEFVQENTEEPHVLEAHIRSIRREMNVAEIAKQRVGTRGDPATRTRGSLTWSGLRAHLLGRWRVCGQLLAQTPQSPATRVVLRARKASLP